MFHALQGGSPSSPGGSNFPVNLEHWVMRSRPQNLSVSDTQVWTLAHLKSALPCISYCINESKMRLQQKAAAGRSLRICRCLRDYNRLLHQ